MPIPRPLIRFAVTAFQRMRRLVWFVTRPEVNGVHAVAFTPAGKVVLVRLTYADGWRLPGGGRGRKEDAVAAMLRELREEIGLLRYGSIRHAFDYDDEPDFRRDHSSVFRLDGVEYRPRRTFEIDEVGEFDPAALPADMPQRSRAMVLSVCGQPERPAT